MTTWLRATGPPMTIPARNAPHTAACLLVDGVESHPYIAGAGSLPAGQALPSEGVAARQANRRGVRGPESGVFCAPCRGRPIVTRAARMRSQAVSEPRLTTTRRNGPDEESAPTPPGRRRTDRPDEESYQTPPDRSPAHGRECSPMFFGKNGRCSSAKRGDAHRGSRAMNIGTSPRKLRSA